VQYSEGLLNSPVITKVWTVQFSTYIPTRRRDADSKAFLIKGWSEAALGAYHVGRFHVNTWKYYYVKDVRTVLYWSEPYSGKEKHREPRNQQYLLFSIGAYINL
jgi:hypothetical protein